MPQIKRLRASSVLLLALAGRVQPQTSGTDRIDLNDRIVFATKLYSAVRINFAQWQNAPSLNLDEAYRRYVGRMSTTDDRFEFDIATMEFFGALHSGHSSFFDSWLDEHYGQPIGFKAAYRQSKWVVTESRVEGMATGDVIAAIDGKPLETFFQEQRRFVPSSNERQERVALFNMPFLFPERFVVTLEPNRAINIDRASQKLPMAPKPEATSRWVDEGKIAYVRIPTFNDPAVTTAALDAVKRFGSSANLIVDVRHNSGGNTPWTLIHALMDRPYRWWAEATPALMASLAYSTGTHPELSWAAVQYQPQDVLFRGRLFILIDDQCFSACEDFVVPFADNHRAVLVGESTAGSSGQPSYGNFGNGMGYRIAAKREIFPDGRPFEGVGISPDVESGLSINDIKTGRDAVLSRAIQLARQ
jgi:carboxyl-terminal processing protease